MEPTLTLHGLWPSFSTPVDFGSRDGCYWPQNCEKPSWYPSDAPWAFDRRSVPPGRTAERLAPAWAFDGLGAHEWAKHGTCAAWVDARGTSPGMTQVEFMNATFRLAEALGTPRALTDAAGTDVAVEDAQAASAAPRESPSGARARANSCRWCSVSCGGKTAASARPWTVRAWACETVDTTTRALATVRACASSPPIKRRVIAPPTSPRRADAVIEALYEYSFFLYCTVAFCSEIFLLLSSLVVAVVSRRHFPPARRGGSSPFA